MTYKLLFLDQFGTLGGGQRVLLETLNSLDRAQYQTMVALGTRGDFREQAAGRGHPRDGFAAGKLSLWEKDAAGYGSFLLPLAVLRAGIDRLGLSPSPRSAVCQRSQDVHLRNPRRLAHPAAGDLASAQRAAQRCRTLSAGGVLPMGAYHRGVFASGRTASAGKKPSLQSKIRLIYNPVPSLKQPTPGDVDRLRESFGVQPKQVCIGILGRITPFKGQWHFLQAARLVLQQTQKARFFVIGSPAADKSDQEYYSQLRLTVEQSGMKNSVFFVEHQREVEKYLAMMDVVVVASQGPEALPQTIIEAMSMGKAVIAPASGGIVEILEDGKTGLFAEVDEPEKLAAAMMKVIRRALTSVNPWEALRRRGSHATIRVRSLPKRFNLL